jgi:hypothetical protein
MSDSRRKPVFPPIATVRQRIAEHVEDARRLRRLLKIAEEAAQEEFRRRNQTSRFRHTGDNA